MDFGDIDRRSFDRQNVGRLVQHQSQDGRKENGKGFGAMSTFPTFIESMAIELEAAKEENVRLVAKVARLEISLELARAYSSHCKVSAISFERPMELADFIRDHCQPRVAVKEGEI